MHLAVGFVLLFLSWKKIINGCFLFYCLEFVCKLGSGGAMCLGCKEKYCAAKHSSKGPG